MDWTWFVCSVRRSVRRINQNTITAQMFCWALRLQASSSCPPYYATVCRRRRQCLSKVHHRPFPISTHIHSTYTQTQACWRWLLLMRLRLWTPPTFCWAAMNCACYVYMKLHHQHIFECNEFGVVLCVFLMAELIASLLGILFIRKSSRQIYPF